MSSHLFVIIIVSIGSSEAIISSIVLESAKSVEFTESTESSKLSAKAGRLSFIRIGGFSVFFFKVFNVHRIRGII